MTTTEQTLPPLPLPCYPVGTGSTLVAFSLGQMRAYASEAVRNALATQAPALTDDRIKEIFLSETGFHLDSSDWALMDAIRALLAAAPAPAALTDERITDIIRSVAELPDRNSPEDWPEAMLVTADELRALLAAASPTLPPLTDQMRAILRNEKGTYQSEDELYAALVAASTQEKL